MKTNNVGKDILNFVDITEEAIVGGGKAVLIFIREMKMTKNKLTARQLSYMRMKLLIVVLALKLKELKETETEIVGMDMDDNSSTNSCDICRSDKAKNECGKCGNNFCSECEFKFNGESVFEFFKINKFQNYTCSTVHN